MIHYTQFKEEIIIPVLEYLEPVDPGINSTQAVTLLMGTHAKESMGGYYFMQMGGGPAVGGYQIEPTTHQSKWEHYFRYREAIAEKVRELAPNWCIRPDGTIDDSALQDPFYATAIARYVYRPIPQPIPEDLEGMALYWDNHYNRNPQHGTPKEFLSDYERYVKSTT